MAADRKPLFSPLDDEQIKEYLVRSAARDVRKLIANAGFHPDHTIPQLAEMLIDAWWDGGQWGAKIIVAALGDDEHQAVRLSALIAGYTKRDRPKGLPPETEEPLDPQQIERMGREHAAWLDVGQEFAAAGLDMNSDGARPLVNAIRKWGEELHQLRRGSRSLAAQALREAREAYEGRYERGPEGTDG